MNIAPALFLLASLASPAVAGIWVDCRVDATLDLNIENLSLGQEVGAERLECSQDGGPDVSIVRTVRARARTRSSASARGNGNANARFDWSGNGSGCETGTCTCRASGSTSTSCSDSESQSKERSAWSEEKLIMARASYEQLAKKGFSAAAGQDCHLKTADGKFVEMTKALAIVSWLHGERLAHEDAPELFRAPAKIRSELPDAKTLGGQLQ